MGSMVLAFMSLYLTKELGFGMTEAGIVLAAYGVGSILGSYLGGWLTDRKDYYNVLVYSLIGSGLILIPIFFITNYYLIIVNVFLYALAADAFRPANSVAIGSYSTDENRTRSISLIRLAVNLGFAIGPAIGGIAATTIGFKWIFLIDAATSILAGIFILMYLPKIQKQKDKSEKEKPKMATSVFYDRSYLIFLMLVSIYGTLFFQLFASVPVYMSKDFGYSEDTIGYLLGLNGLMVVLLEMPIIYRIENKSSPSYWIAFGCMMMVIAYTLLSLGINSLVLCVIYTLFITLSEIFAMPFMMNYALSKPEKERQGQYTAMYSVAYGFSNIIAPSLGLGFADIYSFHLFYGIAALASVLLGVLFYRLMK
jgi:predicted MFS family arabinose efflux permease